MTKRDLKDLRKVRNEVQTSARACTAVLGSYCLKAVAYPVKGYMLLLKANNSLEITRADKSKLRESG